MDDFETQTADIKNRINLARQNTQYQAPKGRMAGRIYVAPNALEYLAAGLRSASAGRDSQLATNELQELQGKRQTAMIDALRKSNEFMSGSPAVPEKRETVASELGDESIVTQDARPAQAPDPFKAANALINSGIPALQTAGFQQQMELQKQKLANTQQQQHLGILSKVQSPQEALDAGVPMETVSNYFKTKDIGSPKPIVVGNTLVDPKTFQPVYTAAPKVDMAKDYLIPDGKGGYMPNTQLIQVKKSVQEAGRQPPPPRNVQIIQTDSGPMQIVDGVAMPIQGPGGKPIGPVKTPEAVQKTNDANAALATINQAREIIPKSTGSYIGAGVDTVGQVFGVSTPGAQASAKLKALEGDLVSKMPKMSGPQSDKDVALYRQMAGVIGDPTTPPATKLAALDTIEEIQKRYAGQAPAMPMPTQQTGPRPQNLPQTGRIRFDANGNIIQ